MASARPVKKVHDLGMNGGPLDDSEKVTLLVCMCSGWVMFLEGINGMSGLAISYYFKETLKLSPATITSVSSITALPWTCKPLYGFMSDAFPLFGYRSESRNPEPGSLKGAVLLLLLPPLLLSP
ncbi:hypothetical protein T484DRAFT_1800429 [Baffinella frigidus]|nr:hypothetical protein T484DRAFT_1800429 [Cryptophyta sp. CCMP2293]